MERQSSGLYRPFKGDEFLVVRFFMDDRKNEVKTQEAGYAVYEDIEMVSISIPGDKQTNAIARANAQCTMSNGKRVTYIERFPDDYDRFRAGHGAALVGLPLKHAPFLSKSEVSMLANQNVFTVEQLADMGGAPMRSLGPSGRKWQQQAVAFLKTAAGTRDATKEAATMAAMQSQIDALKAALEAQGGVVPVADVAQDDEAPADDEASRKVALKDEIERLTGARPRGNAALETLERMLAEAREAA